MMVFTALIDSWIATGLLLLVTLLLVLYWYASITANYFKDRNIPYLHPLPVLGQPQVFTKHQLKLSEFLYKQFPGERFYGYFQSRTPVFLIKDPDLVQRVMVKDFDHFYDRGFPFIDNDPLAHNLFNLKGQTWRNLRQKLIVTFTTGKLKQMFPQLVQCADHLAEDANKATQSEEPVEARLFINGFGTEVIGTTAFGLDFRKESSQGREFISMMKKLMTMSVTQVIRNFLTIAAPKILKVLKIRVFFEGARLYFFNLVKNNKAFREKNNIVRNDYFQLLLNLQKAEETGQSDTPVVDYSEEDALIHLLPNLPQQQIHFDEKPKKLFTDEFLTAQSMIFLFAGSESISTTLSFLLYFVAKNREIQKQLVEEISIALAKHGGFTYQALKEMTYLDMVIQETQRLFPIVPMLMRECTLPYPIPGSNVVMEKGTIVAIPIGGMQRDSKYYPSPEKFIPERFIDNNHKPNPYFMPFGDGPRICIAIRFAILEMKVCAAKILSEYSIQVNKKTKEPFEFSVRSFFPVPKGGIWIDFRKRQEEIKI